MRSEPLCRQSPSHRGPVRTECRIRADRYHCRSRACPVTHPVPERFPRSCPARCAVGCSERSRDQPCSRRPRPARRSQRQFPDVCVAPEHPRPERPRHLVCARLAVVRRNYRFRKRSQFRGSLRWAIAPSVACHRPIWTVRVCRPGSCRLRLQAETDLTNLQPVEFRIAHHPPAGSATPVRADPRDPVCGSPHHGQGSGYLDPEP